MVRTVTTSKMLGQAIAGRPLEMRLAFDDQQSRLLSHARRSRRNAKRTFHPWAPSDLFNMSHGTSIPPARQAKHRSQ